MRLSAQKEFLPKIITSIFTLCAFFTFSQNSVIGEEIAKIELEYIKGGKPSLEKQLFGIGIITTLADGSEVLSKSLRGSQDYREYIMEISGAYLVSPRAPFTMYYSVESCEELKNSSVVIKIKREEDKDWLLVEEIPIICEGSTPVVAQSKVDVQKQLNEVNYWNSAPKVNIIPDEAKVYTPRKNDTLLYSTDAPKNVAFLKEESKLLVLKSYSSIEPNVQGRYQEFMQFGYSLDVYQESASGKLTLTSSSSKELKFEINRPISITSFKAIPSGYVVCSPEMVLFFDKNYTFQDQIVYEGEVNERIFIDIDQIGNTNDFALIMADTDAESEDNKGVEVFSMIYNKSEKAFYEKSKISLAKTLEKNHDDILNPSYCKVASRANNQFSLFYKNSDEDARAVSWNVSKVKEGRLFDEDSRYWTYEYDTRTMTNLRSLNLTNPKAVKAIYGTTNLRMTIYSKKASAVQFNLLAMNQQEFDASLKQQADGEFSQDIRSHYLPQSNGYTLIAESSTVVSQDHSVEVVRVFDQNMKFLGQFRVGIPVLAEIMKYGYKLDGKAGIVRNSKLPNGRDLMIGDANRAGRRYQDKYQDEGPKIFSIRGGTGSNPFLASVQHASYAKLDSEPEAFFLGNAYAEYILSDDGKTLYMMSPFAIVKLNLQDVVEYKAYAGPSNK